MPREVGKVGTQSPDYLKPVSERKGNIASFFAKQPLKKEDKKESKSSSQNTGETSKKAVAEDEKQSKAFAAEVNEEVEKDKAKEIASKGHNEQSHRESQSAKRDASPVKGDAVDLPLNPDEGEAIASEVGKKSQASGNSKRMSTSKSPSTPKKDKQKAIVVDDASSEVGDSKTAAIILSDLDSGSESEKAISKNRSSKRKRSQDSTSAAAPTKRKKASVDKKACSTTASPPANRAKTRSKGSTESSTADTKSKRARRESHTAAVTDHQGNKKLENFFEVKDD